MLWKDVAVAFALLSVLASRAARPCLAGESFLDRNVKLHEAVPYGRTIDEATSRTSGVAAGQREEDGAQHAAPPSDTPSGPVEPKQDPDPGTREPAEPR